ncbi:hypothetical protein ACFVTY_38810 [Streptomyces sp. NPDC058067]|uniref:hypothetical protein n=1 Tax=Streptomyces sp. NPDC058067 TaxID=3346324 RepID=UPI0036EEC87D
MDLLTRIRSQWDRVTAAVTAMAGAVTLVLGWRGVSGTPYPAEQLPYVVSAGLGSLFLLGVSSALWLSADLRDEWRKLDRIEQALRAAGETAVPTSGPTSSVPAPVPASQGPAQPPVAEGTVR